MFQAPPSQLALGPNEVHVWRARLDVSQPQTDAFRQTLSDDERARAARYHFERHRRRFLVARGTLRVLLGRYLGLAPERVTFEYGQKGKPALAARVGEKTIDFNVSHAHELAVFAFAYGRAVGIDIEYLARSIDYERLAQRFFSAREVETLLGVAEPSRKLAFFNCWTRKEAFLKATAEGLSRPLEQFEVSLAPGDPARLLNVAACPEEVGRWTLSALDLGPGYVGALAVRGTGWTLACFEDEG